jgi:hypothetical protein
VNERGLNLNWRILFKFIFKKSGHESVDGIRLAQDRDMWQTFVAAGSIKCRELG